MAQTHYTVTLRFSDDMRAHVLDVNALTDASSAAADRLSGALAADPADGWYVDPQTGAYGRDENPGRVLCQRTVYVWDPASDTLPTPRASA